MAVVSDGEEPSEAGAVFLRKKLKGDIVVVIMAEDLLSSGFDLSKVITPDEYDQLVLANTA